MVQVDLEVPKVSNVHVTADESVTPIGPTELCNQEKTGMPFPPGRATGRWRAWLNGGLEAIPLLRRIASGF
jgi:hypothetical protein